MLAACAGAPSALDRPPVPLVVDHRPHTTTSAAKEEPRQLTVQLLATRTAPVGVDVASAAVVIAAAAGQPFRGASSLPPGTLWLDAASATACSQATAAAENVLRRGSVALVVAPGLATRLRCELPGLPMLEFTAATGGTELTVLHRAPDTQHEERLHLGKPLTAGSSGALFVPGDTPPVAGHMLVVTDTGPATASDLATARAAAAASPPPNAAAVDVWQLALAAVGEHNRRPALLALARTGPSPRAEDLLLAADERALITITSALQQLDCTTTPSAWQFEGTLWRALLPRAARVELSPALYACFLRHLGAAAIDTSLLQEMLAGCADGGAFATGLGAANLDALDDREAAVRVRAFDWLGQHGVTVPDYEPFAPAKLRRAALRRFQLATTTTEPR